MAKDKATKQDDTRTGVLSISRSQMNRAKKAAQAKGKAPIKHGGICSSCGLTSTSCTTNTPHTACVGYYQGDLGDPILNAMGEEHAMLYDGTIITKAVPGQWVRQTALTARRAERALEAQKIARTKVKLVSVFAENADGPASFVRVDAFNGLGEPICWISNVKDGKGAWLTEDEAQVAGVKDRFNIDLSQRIDAAKGARERLNDVLVGNAEDAERSLHETFPNLATVNLT